MHGANWTEWQKFFRTLTFVNFEVSLATRSNGISFESPDIGAIIFSFKKSLSALLRYFYHSNNPRISNVYLVRVPFIIGIASYMKFYLIKN